MTSRDPRVQRQLELGEAAALAPLAEQRSDRKLRADGGHRVPTLDRQHLHFDYLEVIAGKTFQRATPCSSQFHRGGVLDRWAEGVADGRAS
jgi:hypothetical protein